MKSWGFQGRSMCAWVLAWCALLARSMSHPSAPGSSCLGNGTFPSSGKFLLQILRLLEFGQKQPLWRRSWLWTRPELRSQCSHTFLGMVLYILLPSNNPSEKHVFPYALVLCLNMTYFSSLFLSVPCLRLVLGVKLKSKSQQWGQQWVSKAAWGGGELSRGGRVATEVLLSWNGTLVLVLCLSLIF